MCMYYYWLSRAVQYQNYFTNNTYGHNDCDQITFNVYYTNNVRGIFTFPILEYV